MSSSITKARLATMTMDAAALWHRSKKLKCSTHRAAVWQQGGCDECRSVLRTTDFAEALMRSVAAAAADPKTDRDYITIIDKMSEVRDAVKRAERG